MKILLINSLYFPNFIGGAERSVQILAESLVAKGNQVSMICLAKKDGEAVINGVKVYYLKLANIYWPFGQRHSLLSKISWHALDIRNRTMARHAGKIIMAEQPDVVHTHNLTGFSVAIWKEAKKGNFRIVHTIRDFYLLCFRSSMFKSGRNCIGQCGTCRLFSFWKKAAASYVDHVVGISDFALKRHRMHGFFNNTPSDVIYNSFSKEKQIEKIASHKIRFGYIGRLAPTKGVDLLLEAFEEPEIYNKAELRIAGEGEEAFVDSLKQRASNSYIHFLGTVLPEDFYSKIDVLVVPSKWHEPLGRVIFEAYSFGVPVIGSDRGGIPEIINQESTGYVFNPDSTQNLVMEMMRFIDQPRLARDMSGECMKKAQEFLPDVIASKYVAIYLDLLQGETVA